MGWHESESQRFSAFQAKGQSCKSYSAVCKQAIKSTWAVSLLRHPRQELDGTALLCICTSCRLHPAIHMVRIEQILYIKNYEPRPMQFSLSKAKLNRIKCFFTSSGYSYSSIHFRRTAILQRRAGQPLANKANVIYIVKETLCVLLESWATSPKSMAAFFNLTVNTVNSTSE